MKYVYALLPLLALSACSTVEPLRPDMQARPIPSRLDEIAYINGLRKAYVSRASNAQVPCYDGKDLKAFRPKFVQGFRETDDAADKATPANCLEFLARVPNSADGSPAAEANALADYLDNGFGLADLYCSRFMVIAAETRQARQLQKKTFAAVDVMVGTVLSAVSAGTNLINAVNGGFGLVGSTYDNIDSAFVITPEKDTLVRLVQAAQSAFRAQVRQKPPQSFAEGRSVIEKYSSMCTFDGMRGMVNASITESTQNLKSESEGQPAGGAQDSADVAAAGLPPKKVGAAARTPPKLKPTINALLPAF